MKSKLNVVAIGGGTGLSVLLYGLKKEFENITAIVTVSDDGGSSGILREDLGMLPPGDIRSCIIALANTEPAMENLMRYRFKDGLLKNQSFGNILIAAMNEISGNFETAIKKISDILAITGKVLPVTNQDVHLKAKLKNGMIIEGESSIPIESLKNNSGIDQIMYNKDNVQTIPEVKNSILEADIILVGPGSLYTSVMPNILIDDVKKALIKAKGRKIFIPNIMSQPGETDGYSLSDHIKVVNDYIGENIFDYVLINNGEIEADVKNRYLENGSKYLKMNSKDYQYFNDQAIDIIEKPFVEVKKGYVRHDSQKIAEELIYKIDTKLYEKK